ncbi:hypothetical protein [Caproicibacter sp.]|uniref:hypothetical protein n=1 Tax=Caproicibacter sp. TaxID=2814884 RepID=UPI00398A255B
MKKLICTLLVSLLLITSVSPAFAISKSTNAISALSASVTSNEFPNAYIKQRFVANPKSLESFSLLKDGKNVGYVTATAYVEETYEILNSKPMITSSRLLSKKEVKTIGEQNFSDINSAMSSFSTTKHKHKVRGKFSMTFTVKKYSNQYKLQLINNWDINGFWNSGSNGPAAGPDYMGFAWGGGFDYDNYDADTENSENYHSTPDVADISPNGGIAWSFDDLQWGSHTNIWVKNSSCWTTIGKNTLTGKGNTTSVVGEYIHTWKDVQGSLSFSTSGDIGINYSIKDKKWSLKLSISGIPY